MKFSDLNKTDSFLTLTVPVFVIILNRILSHERKASLLYFKKRGHALPGNRVLTQMCHPEKGDSRISVSEIDKRLGTRIKKALDVNDLKNIPEGPPQNSFWYQLYREQSDHSSVQEIQKQYLLLISIWSLSLLFLLSGLVISLGRLRGWWSYSGSFLPFDAAMAVLCFFAWLAAGKAGKMFVRNVVVEACYEKK